MAISDTLKQALIWSYTVETKDRTGSKGFNFYCSICRTEGELLPGEDQAKADLLLHLSHEHGIN